MVRNVNVQAQTPLWMVEKLRRAGVRSIDPVVDITNYVLQELGQPMHGFDLDCLDQKIIVRESQQGEKVTLLDGTVLTLEADTLVIADANKIEAIAGIMGADGSAVDERTQDVFLES